MSMKAWIEVADRAVTGIVARPLMVYDGVTIHFTGASGGKAARIDVTMRPEEALCLALALIKESEKHGHDTLRRVAFIRKNLNKAAQKGAA
jgi:hypothetical protein